MRLLVTGGCGFIGSNLIRYLLETYPNHSIINLDALTYAGNRENLADIENDPRYSFVKGDICDSALVDSLVKDSDAVIHLAAEVSVDRSIQDPNPFVRTNITGTHVLLEACRRNGLKRFHYVSTDEVFGSLGKTGTFSEDSPFCPSSPYAATKASATHLVQSYHTTYALPVTISYSSNNLGPYQFPDAIIPRVITALLDSDTVPLHGKGCSIRDWLAVSDHVRALDLILHKGTIGESYCIGGGYERRTRDVVTAICSALNSSDECIRQIPERVCQDARYALDTTKIRTELGWKPEVSFERALHETIAWYRENRDWWQPLKKRMMEY
jgi:dTDP-glucose 4,6-dehydratase